MANLLGDILGLAKERHTPSNQREGLDETVLHLTKSILLRPPSSLEHGPTTPQALFALAKALLICSDVSKQPRDAIFAATFLFHLRGQPQGAFGVPPHRVTSSLVDALVLQVRLKAENVMKNIGEMAVLYCELLASDAFESDTTRSILLICEVILSNIRPGVPGQPLDQVVDCLRAARRHKPDLRVACYTLAFSLCIRYCMTFANGDYEEATSLYDEVITSSPPGDSQDTFAPLALQQVTALAMFRSKTHQTPEYFEEAIYRARDVSSSSPSSVPPLLRTAINEALQDTKKERSRYFGSIEGLGPRSGGLPLSQQLALEKGNTLEADRMSKKVQLLEGLLSEFHGNNITDVEGAIEKGRTILASSAPSDPYAYCLLSLFGPILFEGFKRTNFKNIKYLDESIGAYRRILEYPGARNFRSLTHSLLALALLTRSVCFPGHRMQDLNEGMELFSQCATDGHASLTHRFRCACLWASFARLHRHSSLSTAYECAMSSMQNNLLFAPTLQLQHATLAESSDVFHVMPLEYASYQVDQRQHLEAIVTLERGRALLWSEMRHLRAPIDQLQQAHPQLAHSFAAINRDLEALTKSVPPSHKLSIDDGAADDLRAVDPFGRLLLKQRKLLNERDNLTTQIQALPSFENFPTSPSFDTLRSAASSGPVIIINHTFWRSDILILLHDASPSLISTPRDFYHRASTLRDKLLDSRQKYGLDSSHYDEILAFVLAELYKLVGKPVIDRLRQLKVPEQSRIWWCPTSVFCSLPLHAMGPIPSGDGERHYFLDLYICSYTPALSALIQSRNRDSGSRSSDRPSLLLVAQPHPSLPTVGCEIQVVQSLDTEVTNLISKAATPAAVVDCFRHHQFVHFACHGTLETGKPFEAGFELYGGERLTLLEIVRSNLATAEFAFLSACHTAEVTEGSVVDEGLHLAAAVQYCGFRSVVGTMWAMADVDGRDLAKQFYKALFSTSEGEQGIPYHERSAKALRFAVKKLRRKRRMTLERWVNFVHYAYWLASKTLSARSELLGTS
ncbi:CHAT domain-containing protein [Lactarius akahatsu]|uniref:CHAT domain-containing protein n=1 Tax=Lactarius akahatsu TaxID=416441 RepID=A0AAD4L5X5_9AGAM|nr:CHAT domain-containing protein [Lactarius akahatsu]